MHNERTKRDELRSNIISLIASIHDHKDLEAIYKFTFNIGKHGFAYPAPSDHLGYNMMKITELSTFEHKVLHVFIRGLREAYNNLEGKTPGGAEEC